MRTMLSSLNVSSNKVRLTGYEIPAVKVNKLTSCRQRKYLLQLKRDKCY